MFEARISPGQGAAFPMTDWAVVAAAGTDEEQSRQDAWAELCRLYWYPIYVFVKRRYPWKSHDEVCELTQQFFFDRIRTRDIRNADPTRGQFRKWLKKGVKSLVCNRYHHDHAQRRDPAKEVRVDSLAEECRARWEPRTHADPERVLERDEAVGVLGRALLALKGEYEARGDGEFFDCAWPLLEKGRGRASYPELEQSWGIGRGTLNVRVFRMRARYELLIQRELLRVRPGESKEAGRRWLEEALAMDAPEPVLLRGDRAVDDAHACDFRLESV